jgi:two-component system, NarL family, sensor histidine kinase UhpB
MKSRRGKNILIVEDNPGDQLLLTELLKSSELVIENLHYSENLTESIDTIRSIRFDIILLDLSLPDSSGLQTFLSIKPYTQKVPVVILSGLADMELAIAAISEGAQDYLIKDDMDERLLVKTIRYSIERKKNLEEIQRSEEQYRYLFNNNPACIFIWYLQDFLIADINETVERQYGYNREELLEESLLNIQPEKNTLLIREIAKKALRQNKYQYTGVFRQLNKEGEEMFMQMSSHRIEFNNKPAMLSLGINITDRIMLEKKLEEEKYKKDKEITQAVITAQEHEREEIGRELHDNINQILACSRLYLGLMRKENAVEYIDETDKLLNTAIEEIRGLSHTLIPPSFVQDEFLMALNNIIDITMNGTSLHIERDFLDLNVSNLTNKLRLTIYRIIQKQFNNILKYSKARTVSVCIKQQENIVLLTIKDDGIGCDPTAKTEGVGLMNIRTRASFFNGDVKVVSAPEKGFELHVKFINV